MQDHDTRQTPAVDFAGRRRWAIVVILGAVAVLVLFVGARLAASLVAGDAWNVEPGVEVVVSVSPGTPASTIYSTLHEAGVARASQIQAAARTAGVEDQLQAGTYLFTTDMDPDEVVRQLLLGGDAVDGSSITIIEGWTINRILDELAARTPFERGAYETALTSGNITSPMLPELGDDIDAISRWEGLLYPAKYQIGDGSTPESILSRMATEMTIRIADVDWSRLDELGIDRYEALIIASLIQREAGIDADRPLISSVIHNRLAEDMRLQIDATVVYALGGVIGRVTGKDLKIASPYNTYLVDGLPPTPIGTIQDISLDAAVHPASTDYLFYVLVSKDGAHAFAETYEEHQANIELAKEAGVRP